MEISVMIKGDQRRDHKRSIASFSIVLIVVAMLQLILSACGGSGGAGGVTALRVQATQGPGAQALQQAASDFEKSHPNVKISIETVDDTTSRGPNISVLSSPNAPDIGYLQRSTGVYSTLVQNNEFVNLDSLWQKNNLASQYGTQVASYFTTNSHHYAVLLDALYISPIFYQKHIFAQAHVSAPANHQFTSMDQWYALVNGLHKAGFEALGVGGASPYDLGHDMDALLPTAVTKEQSNAYLTDWQPGTPETAKYTDSGFVNTLQTLMDWKQRNVFESGFMGFQVQQVQGEFAAGKLAMIQGGSYSPSSLEQAGVNANDLGWFMLPPMTPGVMTPFDVYTGDSYVIPTHAKHQQLAEEFLSYFLQPDILNKYAAAGGSITPYANSLSDSVIKQYEPIVQDMLAYRQKFGLVGIWDSDIPGEIGQKTEVPLLQAMLSGQATVQQTAQKFQDALDHVRSEPPAPLD